MQNGITALVIDSGFSRISKLLTTLSKRKGVSIDGITYPPGFMDNINKLGYCQVPTLFRHGTDDSLISSTEAEDNFNASIAEKKKLVCVPGAGHNNLSFISGDDYYLSISSFLGRL